MARSKRLRHRVPVRLRQNWRLVALCAAFLAVCWGVFGGGMIRPYVTAAGTAEAGAAVTDLTGGRDLFDGSAPHDIRLTFAEQAYEDMLAAYFKEGEKKYVEADLVIDGVRVPSVGVRLKGNSTLRGLTWNGRGQGGFGGGPRWGGMTRTGLKAEEPENLPWLISFDEFVKGRRYQGHSQVAVRPAAMGSATLLNEALGIALVGAAGEPTQRSVYSSFTVNGRASAPRLVVEYLDEGYAERLGDGVLYKALAGSSFTYKGEDQTRYTEDFKQVNKVGGRDLQPVIDLMKWVRESSDAEFEKGLPERLDVESFARYAALQNIMVNFDDMAGPGRNYYLWYDTRAGRFTVVNWDLNLAFGGDPASGVHDTIRMGGFGGRRLAQPQQQGREQGQRQGGPPDMPGGFGPPGGGERPGGGGMLRMGHPLKERFLANATFKRLYEEQYRALYARLLASGAAADLLDGLVAAYKLNDGADTATVEAEAQSLRTFLRTRVEALASDEAITGA